MRVLAENQVKKTSLFVLMGVLSVYLIQGAVNGINPAVAGLIGYYKDIPMATVILIATMPTLCSIFANFLTAPLIKQIKLKGTLVISLILFILGGIAPVVFPDNFNMVLAARVVNGIGYGIAFPLCAIYVATYFHGQEQQKVMGWGGAVASISGIGFALIGGALASADIQLVWWVNAIMVFTLLYGLTLPAPEAVEVAAVGGVTEKTKLPTKIWFWILGYGVYFLFAYTFFIYVSVIVTSTGMGDAVSAGFILTMFSIGGFIGGIVFGKLLGAFQGRLLGISMVITSIVFAAAAFSNSYILILIAAFIGGFGFMMGIVLFFTGVGMESPPMNMPFAMGAMVAIGNLGSFISNYMVQGVASVLGQSANLRFPMYINFTFFIVVGILFTIKKKKIGPM